MKNRKGSFWKPVLVLALALAASGCLQPAEEAGSCFRLLTAARGAAASGTDSSAGEEALLQAQYDAAQALYDAGDYEKALEAFEALGSFSNSRARASDSRRKWRAASYQKAVDLFDGEQYQEALDIFESLGSYQRSRRYVYECTMAILRAGYQQAKEYYDAGDYRSAQAAYESLGRFRDSPARAQEAADRVKAQEQAARELSLYEEALTLKAAGDLEAARDTFILAGPCEGATEQLYEVLRLMTLGKVYERAEADLLDGRPESAWEAFRALGDYADSPEKAALAFAARQAAVYEQAGAAADASPARAYLLYLSLEAYEDSAALADNLRAGLTEAELYAAADALALDGDDALAALGFEAAAAYGDSRERGAEAGERARKAREYRQALLLRELGEEAAANDLFRSLGDFQDAQDMILPLTPRLTTKQLRDDKTSPVSETFTAPDGSRHRYQIYKGVHTWVEAKAFCEVLGGHLATLTTPEENAFVHAFMRESGYTTAYFGLSDEARTGDWVWVTGEPFEYKNWHRGEPSRSGFERYGMFFYKHTDGTWNDSHFYEKAEVDPGCSYICEWDE